MFGLPSARFDLCSIKLRLSEWLHFSTYSLAIKWLQSSETDTGDCSEEPLAPSADKRERESWPDWRRAQRLSGLCAVCASPTKRAEECCGTSVSAYKAPSRSARSHLTAYPLASSSSLFFIFFSFSFVSFFAFISAFARLERHSARKQTQARRVPLWLARSRSLRRLSSPSPRPLSCQVGRARVSR